MKARIQQKTPPALPLTPCSAGQVSPETFRISQEVRAENGDAEKRLAAKCRWEQRSRSACQRMNKKPTMETDDTLAIVASRRASWDAIEAITTSAIPDRAKLEQCVNIANIHCAITGDDSLLPEPIKNARNKLVEELPAMLKRARATRKERDSGMVGML